LPYRSLKELESEVVSCRKCPRLVRFRETLPARAAFRGQEYWRRPVPGFGDASARIVVVGLAPAAHGGNRTGRVFTGDESGRFLVGSLHDVGLANKRTSLTREDGLVLTNCYMTAAVRCVPPGNKPTLAEFRNCNTYLDAELGLLPRAQAIVALGHLAFASVLKWAAGRGAETSGLRFEHGREYTFEGLPAVYACYHPSPRNTYAGVLTRRMMIGLFKRVIKECAAKARSGSTPWTSSTTSWSL
jgi:uracil-DNA glycosylase